MNRNTKLQSWQEEIREFFEWYAGMLEHIQKTRERGYHTFISDVPISIEAFKLRLEGLQNLSTPKLKECKKIQKLLEESIKHRIKALQLETKYFQDIQDGTLAGRLGAGATAFPAAMAGELLEKSLAEFQAMHKERMKETGKA